MDSAILTIPLTKLQKSPHNVRRTDSKAGIEDLAESIAHNGLLQSLSVVSDAAKPGHYLVTGGGRRLAALKLLVKQKRLARDADIPCILIAGNGAEASLAENEMRSSLHPADQFEAFARLADEHKLGLEDIAARFGVTAQVVRKRLRLAAVSPKLMALYKKGGLTLDHMMAFAVTDDQGRQEQVYAQLSHAHPSAIKRAMTEGSVTAGDRRVRLVGLEAYEAPGGHVVRDMFSEYDQGVYLEDVALLDRLVQEKIEATAASLKAEGWSFVEIEDGFTQWHATVAPYDEDEYASDLEQVEGAEEELIDLSERTELSDEEQAKVKALTTELAALRTKVTNFPEDIRKTAGAVVYLDWRGDLQIERGVLRAEETETVPNPSQVSTLHDQTEVEETDKPLANGFVRELTALQTLALRVDLGNSPEVALLALTHALVKQTFPELDGYRHGSPLQISTTATLLKIEAPEIDKTKDMAAFATRAREWKARLGKDESLWETLASLPQADLLELLAHCVSASLFGVRSINERPSETLALIANAIAFDMTDHWRPTAASYFNRVTKQKILEAVAEAISPEAAERLEGLKKADMAIEVERLFSDANTLRWLPTPLRFVSEEA